MPNDQQFGVFKDDGQGPMWRKSFATLDEARFHAQRFADDEGHEFFVYSFKDYSEIARSFPSGHKPKT